MSRNVILSAVGVVVLFASPAVLHAQSRWLKIADHEDDFRSDNANQGSGGWRYGVYVTATSTFNPSEFHTYNAFGTNRVGFSPAWWLSPNGDNGVGSYKMRPSRSQPANDYRWAATGWLSDFQGRIQIATNFRKTSQAGDGIEFDVLKNSELPPLYSHDVSGGSNTFTSHTIDNVNLVRGDRISFIVGSHNVAADDDIISFRAQGATTSSGYFQVKAYVDPTITAGIGGPVVVDEGSTVTFGTAADVSDAANASNPDFATRWRGGALQLTRNGAGIGTQAINNAGGNGHHRGSFAVAFGNDGNETLGVSAAGGNAPSWELTGHTEVWDYASPSATLNVTVRNVAPTVTDISGPHYLLLDQSGSWHESASDPVDALQYQWHLPPTLNPQGSSGPNASGTADQAGDFSIGVDVNDGTDTRSPGTFPVTFLDHVYWGGDGDGQWSNAGRWTDSLVAQGRRITATLGTDTLGNNRTVGLDVDVSLGTLELKSGGAFGYTLSGPRPLALIGPSPLAIRVIDGNHLIAAPISIQKSSQVEVAGGATLRVATLLDAGGNALSRTGGGVLQLSQLKSGPLALSGGTTRFTGTSSVVSDLSISAGATLDLTRSFLVVDYAGPGPGAAIRQAIVDRRITSSSPDPGYAVGWLDTARATPLNWPMLPDSVMFDSTAIGIAYVRLGDTNLDGHVNFDDLLQLSQHYMMGEAEWYTGDLNYDHVINFNDLLSLSQNLEQSPSVALLLASAGATFRADWSLAQSLVPEPSVLACVASCCLLGRVRRRTTIA